jgi:hypothetical protein
MFVIRSAQRICWICHGKSRCFDEFSQALIERHGFVPETA